MTEASPLAKVEAVLEAVGEGAGLRWYHRSGSTRCGGGGPEAWQVGEGGGGCSATPPAVGEGAAPPTVGGGAAPPADGDGATTPAVGDRPAHGAGDGDGGAAPPKSRKKTAAKAKGRASKTTAITQQNTAIASGPAVADGIPTAADGIPKKIFATGGDTDVDPDRPPLPSTLLPIQRHQRRGRWAVGRTFGVVATGCSKFRGAGPKR